MRKALIGLCIAIGVLGIGAIIAYASLAHVANTPADVVQITGDVSVNGQRIAEPVRVQEGDLVETRAGEATLVLHDSVFVTLTPNTAIRVTDLAAAQPVVTQLSGRTTTNFIHATTVTDFAIRNGETTFRATGTTFTIDQILALVVDGRILMEFGTSGVEIYPGEVVMWKDGKEISRRKINDAERALVRNDIDAAIAAVQYRREKIFRDNKILMRMAEAVTGMPQEELLDSLTMYDTGTPLEIDNAVTIAKKYNVPDEITNRAATYTLQIQKLNRMDELFSP